MKEFNQADFVVDVLTQKIALLERENAILKADITILNSRIQELEEEKNKKAKLEEEKING